MCQEYAGLSSRGSQEGLIARPQSKLKLEACCCWWMCRVASEGASGPADSLPLSEDCLQVQKHPQKRPSASETAL